MFSRFVLVAACALPVFPAVIHFDDLADRDVVTNQYPTAVFSSTPGNEVAITMQSDYNGTKPNFICANPIGTLECRQETIVDFTTPVSGLTFQALGIDDIAPDVALVDIFLNGMYHGTAAVAGNAEGYDPRLVDLSAYSGITRIRIHTITDGAGIGWDTFTFNVGVPEPSAFALLGSGLVAAWLGRRRLSKRT